MAATSLWPVVVGGLLTMCGVAVSGGVTIALNRVQARDEQKKRRAEKFEQLVNAVYEFDLWLDIKEDVLARLEKIKLEVSPFAKLEAISAVHFPQFLPKIEELHQATLPYINWMTEAGIKRANGDFTMHEGLKELYGNYAQKRRELLDQLKQYAVDHFRLTDAHAALGG
ncbi:hypothetical protein SAMN05216330_112153 [Bradyrhizobium sp. Ghvi]|uniref:hypothetical protein n=1 Tax=Bradyrhizobium sp. Ghvi TaxID=1855319 RepID=UPI0008E8F80B|nr:hypothetical protein [Bradyrhizobium sp. Ghvi]SFP95094.1 hypothetical protein SAMN05216330_112153 [Bradyrhizobium sp. Ghvi]